MGAMSIQIISRVYWIRRRKKCDKPNDNTLNLKRKKVENVRESTMKKMKKVESERDITKESIVMNKDRFVIKVWY